MMGVKLMRMRTSSITIKNPLNIRSGSRKLFLTVCRSKEDGSSSEGPKPQGDPRRQELLARIVMLQAQKFRLTDYLDERSAFLTQFAEEATAEIDAIGENALKDLDQATARIMEKIERKMQEFEESLEMEKQETEKRDKEVEDFEGEMERGRNEGMFFQSFRQRKAMDKAKAKEEAKRISHVTRKSAASKARRNIYLALIGLLTIGIVNSLLSYPQNWRKIAPLAVVFIALLSQFFYEQKMLPENNGINKDEKTK